MHFAITMPIEKYDTEIDGEIFGMFSSYGHQPALFALIALCTPLLYDWEGDTPLMKRRVALRNIQDFTDTLKCKVKGVMVKDLLETLDPLRFYAHIKDESLEHFPLVKTVLSGDDNPFKLVVGARAAAWGLSYRGKLSTSGNVTKVSFGGKGQGMEVPPDLKLMHEILKEKMANDQK